LVQKDRKEGGTPGLGRCGDHLPGGRRDAITFENIGTWKKILLHKTNLLPFFLVSTRLQKLRDDNFKACCMTKAGIMKSCLC
jgi:hypothetical protein